MKKHPILILAVATVLVVALAAVAQQSDMAQRYQQRREAQMKALDAIQQNAARLKTAMEASGRGMQNYRNLSEDERTRMREQFMQRREEQQKLIADMETELARLKGSYQLWREYDESVASLKDLLASAQSENATATANKIEQMIAERQKQFEEKMTSLGYDPTERPRMRQRQQ